MYFSFVSCKILCSKYKSNNPDIVENAPFDNILSYKPSASSLAMHCKGQSYASKNDVYKISTAKNKYFQVIFGSDRSSRNLCAFVCSMKVCLEL